LDILKGTVVETNSYMGVFGQSGRWKDL